MRNDGKRRGRWGGEELRLRFRPRCRIGRTWLSLAPWLDFVIVIVLVLALHERFLLKPGIVFELPRAPFREGAHSGLTLVVLRVERPAGPRSLVFFDDERYPLGAPDQLAALREALATAVKRHGRRELLLHVDRKVPHGEVVQLVNLAREAGVARVNVSVKTD